MIIDHLMAYFSSAPYTQYNLLYLLIFFHLFSPIAIYIGSVWVHIEGTDCTHFSPTSGEPK